MVSTYAESVKIQILDDYPLELGDKFKDQLYTPALKGTSYN